MKLYYSPSVCSLAVRIILHELGIDCNYEAVNLKTKQTETGVNFLHINPKGAVPALELAPQLVLTENAVILQYLVDHYQANELLPPVGDMQRYRTLEWLNFISTDLHRYCAPLFWSKIPSAIKQDLFIPLFKNKLLVVEKHLENNKFLMGDQFTLPDSYLLVILIWLAKLHTPMAEWPNLIRYFADMKERASVQQALLEEALENSSL